MVRRGEKSSQGLCRARSIQTGEAGATNLPNVALQAPPPWWLIIPCWAVALVLLHALWTGDLF